MKRVTPSFQGHIAGPVSAHESAPVLLDCQAAFQRIANDCVRLIQNNRKFAAAADPDAIHSMRIELARLRAAVLFFSPMTDDAARPGIRKELSWAEFGARQRARPRRNGELCAAKTLSLLGKEPTARAPAGARQRPSQPRKKARLGAISPCDGSAP